MDFGLARGWWRAPLHTFAAFATQSFVDEVAVALKRDPLELRLEMLGAPRDLEYREHGGPIFSTGRLAAVLQGGRAPHRLWPQARQRARHRARLPFHVRRLRGARHRSAGTGRRTGASNAASASRTLAVVVNPAGVEAQLQGGTIDGLSTAIGLQITVEDGRIQQSNFDDYRLMRMPDAPHGRSTSGHFRSEAVRRGRNGHSERGSGARQRDLRGDWKTAAQPAFARLTNCHLTVQPADVAVGRIHVPQVSHSIPWRHYQYGLAGDAGHGQMSAVVFQDGRLHRARRGHGKTSPRDSSPDSGTVKGRRCNLHPWPESPHSPASRRRRAAIEPRWLCHQPTAAVERFRRRSRTWRRAGVLRISRNFTSPTSATNRPCGPPPIDAMAGATKRPSPSPGSSASAATRTARTATCGRSRANTSAPTRASFAGNLSK